MDVPLWHWNEGNKKVEMRYWDSNFSGHSVDTDLLLQFLNSVKDIDKSNTIQVSKNGLIFNVKFYTEPVKAGEEAQLPNLIEIGAYIVGK